MSIKPKSKLSGWDADRFQRLLDLAALADAEEGIRQGLADAVRGDIRPAREVLADFEEAQLR